MTQELFRSRYNALLQKSSIRDNLLARKQVLDAIINEEVLLASDYARDLDGEPEFREAVEAIEQQVILDEYRREVVAGAVEVTDQETREAFLRRNTRLAARHLYAPTEERAWQLKERLELGESFEHLAAITFDDPKLAATGGYLGYFKFGDMDPAFEDAAFALPVGAISAPVRTQTGYSIIRVEDRVTQPIITEWNYQGRKEKLASYLRRRKATGTAIDYTNRLAERLEISFNDPSLRMLVEWLGATDSAQVISSSQDSPEVVYERRLGDILEEPLVRFQGGEWNVSRFLGEARWTSSRQQRRVSSVEELKKFVSGLVVRSHLLREARRHGIHRRDATEESIRRQVRGLKLRRVREWLVEAVVVPDTALVAAFNAHRQEYVEPAQVNVREILVDSERKARMLAAQYLRGADFSELARRHSMREWAAERGGEFGFAPIERFGDYGEQVFAAEVGELVGPGPVGKLWSIMVVIGKTPARNLTFEKARDDVEQELRWSWQLRRVGEYIRGRRDELGIRIDEEVLEWISVGN